MNSNAKKQQNAMLTNKKKKQKKNNRFEYICQKECWYFNFSM